MRKTFLHTRFMRQTKHNRGFLIFFAMLTAALAISIGLVIYNVTSLSLRLSSITTQSQYAIYAADAGAECALYWDQKCTVSSCPTGSAYATSTASVGATAGSGLTCIDSTEDISTLWGTPIQSATAATTTFQLSFVGQSYCAVVSVAKYDRNGVVHTTVVSRGYNTCVEGGKERLERALQLTY